MTRQLKIIFYVCCLVGLAVYGYKTNPETTLADCMEDPNHYQGTLIRIGNNAQVSYITQDGCVVKQFNYLVPVQGSFRDIQVGDRITMLATFYAPGWLEMHSYHKVENQNAKIIISVIPVLILAVIFIREYRLNFSHFWFEKT